MIEILTLVTVLILFVAALWAGVRLLVAPSEGPEAHALGETTMTEASFEARCGPPSADPFIVLWVHGPELEAWIEPASTAFMRACPNTQIRLRSMNDLDAAKAIVEGELAPDAWVPSDSSMLAYLDARWQRAHARDASKLSLEVGASLLHTPLVMLVWRDRRSLFERLLPAGLRGAGGLEGSICAGVREQRAQVVAGEAAPVLERVAMIPQRWDERWRAAHPLPTQPPVEPSLATLESWGRVRVAHASPATSPIGVLSLDLLSRDFFAVGGALGALEEGCAEGDASTELGLSAAVLAASREPLLAWLRRCEAGLDAPLPSARLLTETMFNLGDPARDSHAFDGVITNEQLAFAVLERIDSHEGELRPAELVYLEAAPMLDYPVALLGEPQAEVRGAAGRFAEFLRSHEQQARALELGFRPVAESVSLRDYDLGPNPFTRLRRHGVELKPQLGGAARSEGAALLELVDIWRAATGR